MSSADVCLRIEEVGVVPVVRVASSELALLAAEALLAGGIPILEITLTVPGALQVIRTLSQRFGSNAVVGAGTVLSAKDAEACIDAGAAFLVSPGLDLAMLKVARERGVAVMPGALTPTEVLTAWQAGADMVKVFPCSALGGPKYLRALRGPLPQVRLLPTGGVSLATVADYISAGAAALGVGSELVDSKALETAGNAGLVAKARELRLAVAEARAQLLAPAPAQLKTAASARHEPL